MKCSVQKLKRIYRSFFVKTLGFQLNIYTLLSAARRAILKSTDTKIVPYFANKVVKTWAYW